MAIPTNGLQLVRLAGAVFNQQLSATDYSEILTANKSVAELNSWANSATAAEFKGKTTLDIAKAVLANLGLTVTGLDAWLAGQLTAGGGVAKAGETMLGLLNDYANMTADATFGASATTFNTKSAASQALSLTAGTATGTYAAVSTANAALTLTSAVQTSTGTAGDDTFTGAAGTWGVGDIVNGGTGTDTLNATITGTGPTQSATSLVGVEVLNLTASPNPSTLDLTGVAGLTEVNNVSSANGATLSVTGLGKVVNTTITGGNTSTSIAYATAAVAGTADAATLSLRGAAAGSSFTTSGVETLTINSGTSANTLALSAVGMSKLVVTGDQALTFTGTTGNSGSSTVVGTTTFDLSAATGALTLTTGTGTGGTGSVVGTTVTGPTAATAGALNLTTAGLNDTITLGANANTVDAKAGNDTITSGGGANTITPGTGNDTINAGAGVDTVRFAEVGATNADTINAFGATDVIAVNIGAAAVTGTSAANATASTAFGVVPTGATSPVLQNVGGTATANAVTFQAIAPNATATVGTVAAASNVIALNGAYTDGTAAGVVSALGTSAGVGITTAAAGKFLLVTYSVGNIAQVWSYGGDGVGPTGGNQAVDTNITSDELSLVATLNGVALNGLTAANFSTYLTPVAASTTVSNAGQTFNLSLPLNTVTAVANSAGQYFTAGADTVTANVGALATATATSAQGTTLIDSTTGDGDSFSASVLSATWDAGTVLSNIETVNLTMLLADTALAMATVMPGTTTLNVLGAQNMTGISSIISGTAFGLGAGYTGNLGLAQGATLAAATLNLNGPAGTSAATSPTFSSTAVVTALTVNANATTTINSDAVTTGSIGVFNATTATLNGTGNVTVFGPSAEFNTANIVAASPAYTGTLTFRPSAAVVAGMDFTATGVVTGLKGLDLSDLTTADPMTTADAVLLPAVTGGGTFTVTINPTSTTAVIAVTGLTVTQGGSALTDSMTVAIGANATLNLATGGVVATGTETLTITNAGASTTSTAIGGITLADAAGTQTVTVSGAGNYTLGTVIADTLTTTGVTGTVSATLGNTSGGAAFTGGAGASTIVGTALADNITTGAGGDTVTGGVGADLINVGIGTDNVILASAYLAGALNTVTAQADIVTGFAFGTGNDVLQISAALGYTSEAIANGAGNVVAAADTVVVTAVGAAATTLAAGTNVITVAASVASSTALLTLLGTTNVVSWQANPAAGRELLVVWNDGTNSHVGVIRDADTADNVTMLAAELSYAELATIVGNVTAPVAANFTWIA